MKMIEIDDELYQYIASQTQHIGESASSILRRLLIIKEPSIPLIPQHSINHTDTLLLGDLLSSELFLQEKKLVNRFLLILSALFNCNKTLFSVAAIALHGSKRRYVAIDQQTLIQSGKNTKPKPIPNSPYWVVTNSNTARKIHIIQSIMRNMELSESLADLVKEQFTTIESNRDGEENEQ